MIDDNDARQRLGPFVPTLEQFAREHGMTVKYPSKDNPEESDRGDYSCLLGFVNSSGQLCFMSLSETSQGGLWVGVQRWGLHDLVAHHSWELPAGARPAALRGVLDKARAFVE